jgi:energy-coupling factor transporter ATP-binding protein EcfA2
VTAPALTLERVSYTYPGGSQPVLRDLSLTVEPGELVVVAGASGAGKSTLLRVVNGLVPHFHGGVFSGSARVAGMSTRDHGPGELAVAVGSLFQDPETQVVMGTVRAELALPLENRGEPAAAVARGVEEAALALGVAHLLDRSTAELSGGELQRVALAAALVGRPQLIVLDEPTSQLDPVSGDELLASLRRLNDDTDAAILLAEHRLERCLGCADRVLALDAGRIVCDAPPTDFLRWTMREAPELCTPGGRLMAELGLDPAPGVKAARAALRRRGMLPDAEGVRAQPAQRRAGVRVHAGRRVLEGGRRVLEGGRRVAERERRALGPVLRFDRVWHELPRGPAILRSLSLSVAAGERVALMGRNGAGKSTLLRHAAGLMQPTRGRVGVEGRVALLLQNPGDYLVAERVAAEASPAAQRLVGLDPGRLADRHPRDISVGEKQRLAIAVVLGEDPAGPGAASVLCLDEPTRGLDRGLKAALAELLRRLPQAVVVATHDPEFAAAFAERVVLLAEGSVIADAPIADVLARGSYFATEVARILAGAGEALTPAEGARLIGAWAARATPTGASR